MNVTWPARKVAEASRARVEAESVELRSRLEELQVGAETGAEVVVLIVWLLTGSSRVAIAAAE